MILLIIILILIVIINGINQFSLANLLTNFLPFYYQMAKTKKMSKKSIFATPDTVNGRVGVGTCGIGGRPMTKFSQAEKLNKGTNC